MLCLNNGSSTRINLARGTESAIDLTLVSQSLAGKTNWEVYKGSTVGSDCYPIFIDIGLEREIEREERKGRWKFGRANWNKFSITTEEKLKEVNINQAVDDLKTEISNMIIEAINTKKCQ